VGIVGKRGDVEEAHEDHAERVADAALAMRDFIERFSRDRRLELSMRIGVHAGTLVAGVIGKNQFSYDLWGDTVNTASRMESHGAAGKIHVSEAVAKRLEGSFTLEERGPLSVKGKGEMRTFWLLARAA
jgi:class 3 adenylate cyclase